MGADGQSGEFCYRSGAAETGWCDCHGREVEDGRGIAVRWFKNSEWRDGNVWAWSRQPVFIAKGIDEISYILTISINFFSFAVFSHIPVRFWCDAVPLCLKQSGCSAWWYTGVLCFCEAKCYYWEVRLTLCLQMTEARFLAIRHIQQNRRAATSKWSEYIQYTKEEHWNWPLTTSHTTCTTQKRALELYTQNLLGTLKSSNFDSMLWSQMRQGTDSTLLHSDKLISQFNIMIKQLIPPFRNLVLSLKFFGKCNLDYIPNIYICCISIHKSFE